VLYVYSSLELRFGGYLCHQVLDIVNGHKVQVNEEPASQRARLDVRHLGKDSAPLLATRRELWLGQVWVGPVLRGYTYRWR
jgi:hypothetical protein